MRTVISISDGTFERATRAATALGITRSEFFERAAERYLDAISRESLTRKINEAIDLIGTTDTSNRDAVDAGRGRLMHTSDEW